MRIKCILYYIGLLLVEVFSTIGCLIAFLYPLRKTLKIMREANQNINTIQSTRKLIFIGYKAFILTAVGTLSTLIWLLTFIIYSFATTVAIDFIINCVCLMLFTPYYPDDKWYQKLCYCCITCCDRRGLSYKSTASKGGVGTSPESVDTDQAPKELANKQTMQTKDYTETSIAVSANQQSQVDSTSAKTITEYNEQQQ